MDFFYRKKPWYAGQFVRKIIPKNELTETAILFFSTILNRQKKRLLSVLVRNVDKTFLNLAIQLPVTAAGDINFAFMESLIRELEEERISELDAYLKATGLNNYELTDEEHRILRQSEHWKWKKYSIGKLFKKIKVTTLKYKTRDLPSTPTKEYSLPALTAGIVNQGLNNYVPRNKATILKKVISISANGANTGATFFQSKDFTVLQDAYAIKWNNEKEPLNDNQYIFLVSAISKAIYGNYEWTNKAGWERIKEDMIKLPTTSSGDIDLISMSTYIRAIEKLVIRDVVSYADTKIASTKQVVAKG